MADHGPRLRGENLGTDFGGTGEKEFSEHSKKVRGIKCASDYGLAQKPHDQQDLSARRRPTRAPTPAPTRAFARLRRPHRSPPDARPRQRTPRRYPREAAPRDPWRHRRPARSDGATQAAIVPAR